MGLEVKVGHSLGALLKFNVLDLLRTWCNNELHVVDSQQILDKSKGLKQIHSKLNEDLFFSWWRNSPACHRKQKKSGLGRKTTIDYITINECLVKHEPVQWDEKKRMQVAVEQGPQGVRYRGKYGRQKSKCIINFIRA